MIAKEIIAHLRLQPHPEGGFYREQYRSADIIGAGCLPPVFGGDRTFSTAIYYLLEAGDYSAFHRIKSDELWHSYAGGTLLLHQLSPDGQYQCQRLGSDLSNGDVYQLVMPAGVWFAAEPAQGTQFTLAGCTVSPGFDFADFEITEAQKMLAAFPDHAPVLERLCR